jgi:hypothetical protein
MLVEGVGAGTGGFVDATGRRQQNGTSPTPTYFSGHIIFEGDILDNILQIAVLLVLFR